MKVHTDFTSGKHELVFDDGNRIALTKQETIEFEQWLDDKIKQHKNRS